MKKNYSPEARQKRIEYCRQWRLRNRERHLANLKSWREKNRERVRAYYTKYHHEYYLRNKKEHAAKSEAYRKSHPEKYRIYRKKWETKNKDHMNAWARENNRRIRLEVIESYGGRCACCGESEKDFLTVDHIDGNGHEHRRSSGVGEGSGIYSWLRRNGFPKDNFRLLCWNCNCARGKYGSCPHERRRSEAAD